MTDLTDPSLSPHPLIEAAAAGNVVQVRQLLHAHSTFLSKQSSETINQALFEAAWYGYVEIAEMLLAHGADANEHDQEHCGRSLCGAVLEGNIAVVRLLLAHGAHAGVRDNEALVKACATGNLEMVACLLDAGADAHCPHALEYAAEFGSTEIVELLLQNGASPTTNNSKALQWACLNGDQKMFDLLYPLSHPAAALHELQQRTSSYLDASKDPCAVLQTRMQQDYATEQHKVLTQCVAPNKNRNPSVVSKKI